MSSFVSRPRIFIRPDDFPVLPPALDTWESFPDDLDDALRVASSDPLRWRSIEVTTRTESLDRLDGFEVGMVDALVRLAIEAYRRDLDEAIADGVPLAEFVEGLGDQVVWDDANRVVAILRPLADGSLEDVRFPAAGFLDGSKGGGL